MAQQAVKKQADSIASVPRSPRVGNLKTAGKWDYSRYRITISDPDAFMDFMKAYPNTEAVTLFLYRLVPKIDLSLIGQRESNIQKGSYADLHMFTFDAVAEKFGRGKYNLKVTDANRPQGQNEVVKSCLYKIVEAEKAPVYDIRTLELAHSDNIDEVNRLLAAGSLVRDTTGAPRIRTATDGVPAQPAAPAMASVGGDLFGREFMSQLVLGLIGKASASPHDTVRDTIELARQLHPPAAALDMDAIADKVAAKIGRAPARAAEDPFQAWERIEGWAAKIKGDTQPVANGGGGSAPSWGVYLPSIFAEARSLIPELMGAYRELRAERMTEGNGQNGAQPMPNQQVRTVTIEQRIEHVARLGFAKMAEGMSGWDFAAWVCNWHPGGLEVYQFLEPKGAVGLIGLIASNPAARVLVNDPQIRPQLESFLDSFFSFDPSGDSGSDEPEGPGAAE